MAAGMYSIPGGSAPSAQAASGRALRGEPRRSVRSTKCSRNRQVGAVIEELERDLVGLAPVKSRIRDIAALLVIDKLRMNLGLQAHAPSLHMCFTGNAGTGKTTVALRMAEILHRLGYVRKGHLVAVTRDDLVGQYIGHTAPKTKEVLKRAMGGVLFIDEAYYLYRPENERDYGQEAIEILLQVMENQRDDLVVILAGYKDRMETFLPLQSRHELAHRAPSRLSGLPGRRLAAHRRQDARGAKLSLRPRRPGGVRGVHRASDPAAAFCQCAQRSKRLGSGETTPGKPPVRRRGSSVHIGRPVDHCRVRYPCQPGFSNCGSDPLRTSGGIPTMHLGRTTLSKFLIQQLNGIEGASDLGALLVDVAAAVKAISAMTAKGALGDFLGEMGTKNGQGETQQKLDVVANLVMLRSCEWGGLVAGMASEELDEPYCVPSEYTRGRYLLRVRPARWIIEHRRERLGGNHLFACCAMSRRPPRP